MQQNDQSLTLPDLNCFNKISFYFLVTTPLPQPAPRYKRGRAKEPDHFPALFIVQFLFLAKKKKERS